ncbi:MAG TPA: bifunctional [glutamate--ammonia ligase]-adenylyl-L-tyrosine phosphorylase/[glutamate--ammonia-ligase] adenylyltransferase [Rudaea sp.]|nr:bifunctional [glutamate--ammonia ligase]-adenylyl-L-tyrosine phosphorylase/[glutamate--ammonia-ligase] adenylyltransferase [Rudaea sp.]
MALPTDLSDFVQERYSRLIARCRETGVAFHDDAGVAEHVQRVVLASDFAFDNFLREPELLGGAGIALMSDPRYAEVRALALPPTSDEATAMRALRRYRRAEAVRLIWRDVNGLDSIEDTLAGVSALAETCLAAALGYAEAQFAVRHGVARNEHGAPQRLVVLGLGKLGGGELNFSSDIDLILAYAENGHSDGARPLANETYFARLGQLLVKLLAEITADGYVFRVDLRLRPFGSAGRVALSFAAMEQYYQREGRDWERYAWIKARPVAGDIAAGKRLVASLRPFVYRRYHDYTAFAGLREMKALIDAEVARKDLAQHLKLGAGGIREIEFIVQLLQLIRGGREPSLRETGLLPALAACERLGAMRADSAERLREAYCFLRRIENRVQMLRDEQTHELPQDEFLRARLAASLGHAQWSALAREIARQRAGVAEEFASLWAPGRTRAGNGEIGTAARAYWEKLQDGAGAAELAALGFAAAEKLHGQLLAVATSVAARELSPRARACLDRLAPLLIEGAAASGAPNVCLERLLRLVHAVLRRPAYLALLEEQPAARERLVALFADCALLAEHVIAHPLLLDDVFDARLEEDLPDRASLETEISRRLAQIDAHDAEAEIELLQEEKQSGVFRLGLAYRDERLDAVATARALGEVAETMLARVLDLAQRDVAAQHGRIGAGFAIAGYGSLGGAELGFASDLDLVFVYDGALAQLESDGARPLEGSRYFARIAQRVVHWLTTPTRAGRLYDVDVRLRPDGGKGLLVTSLDAFAEYQRERAWVWEQQALVRARPLAGDAEMLRRFAALRAAVLGQARDAHTVRVEVSRMRARWRAERDRSDAMLLDLKQGAGALLDIEFMLQTLVLLKAHEHAELLADGNSAALIALAERTGALAATDAQALAAAHAALLARSLACTLDARPRLAPRDEYLRAHTGAVLRVAASLGLDFDAPAHAG